MPLDIPLIRPIQLYVGIKGMLNWLGDISPFTDVDKKSRKMLFECLHLSISYIQLALRSKMNIHCMELLTISCIVLTYLSMF